MLRCQLWAHIFQSAFGRPGPTQASTYYIRPEKSNVFYFNDPLEYSFSCSLLIILLLLEVVVLFFSFLKFKQALKKCLFSPSFFRMRVSGSRHTYNFVSSESGITLLLFELKKKF